MCLFERARVVFTAPAAHQVRNILWKELKRVVQAARIPIGGKLHELPALGLQLSDGREVLGITTNETDRLGGISGPNVLFIPDEASGIDEGIFEAIEGNRAGGARLVMFGNPIHTSGTFYEAFTSKREFWKRLTVSSEEAAKVSASIPGLATQEFIDEKRIEWGESNPLYQVRIKGNFPSQGECSVVAIADIEAAIPRWPETPEDGQLRIGVDVARFGDDESVIQPVRRYKALRKTVVHGMDTVDIAGKTLQLATELRRPNEKPIVNVDVIGIGAGVADILRRNDEIELHEINVACAATDEKYTNLRSQLWFAVAMWLREGGSFESDSKLEGELAAPRYGFDAQGRQKIESKDEIKKRLKRSPDRADALCLAVYQDNSTANMDGLEDFQNSLPKHRGF